MTLTRFADGITLSTTRTADPLAAGMERFVGQQRIADAYHAFADVDGFAKVATLDEIRANDGNLSIPLYVRGKNVAESQGGYAADGLRGAVRLWEESSEKLSATVIDLLKVLE